MEMTDEVRRQLNRLSEILYQASVLKDNGKNFGNTERQTLFMTYLDLDEEHLRSLHLLISNNLNGTAFSLVRTFYETFFRAFWVNACATNLEVTELFNDSFRFPKMEKMIKALDVKYKSEGFFRDLADGAWIIMNDYTHSGICSLSRRWKDGKFEENYKEDEILEIIIAVTKTYLIFTARLFQIHGYSEEENKVLEIYKRYVDETKSILEKIDNEN